MAELTGRHVAVITVSAFAVIIAVNMTMAFKAISTFPGLEVANSYVASQTFDAERTAQNALGWTLDATYEPASGLSLRFADRDGAALRVEGLNVLVGRTTVSRDDHRPAFVARGDGYGADVSLDPGKWMMRVEAQAPDGTIFRQRIDLFVQG